jgi:polyisoprenoid-binding protein YceI
MIDRRTGPGFLLHKELRMRHAISSSALLLFAGLLCAVPGKACAQTFNVDPVHSFIMFQIRHLDVSNAWGLAIGATGSVRIDSADPTRNSIQVDLKAENLLTGNSGRDTHIKGPDFLDAKQFPTISFKSTSFKKTSDTAYEVAGNFTLHGVSKPITVTLTKVGEKDTGGGTGYRAGFETTFTIKRSDHGMTGMNMIGDEVKIFVSLETSRAPGA